MEADSLPDSAQEAFSSGGYPEEASPELPAEIPLRYLETLQLAMELEDCGEVERQSDGTYRFFEGADASGAIDRTRFVDLLPEQVTSMPPQVLEAVVLCSRQAGLRDGDRGRVNALKQYLL